MNILAGILGFAAIMALAWSVAIAPYAAFRMKHGRWPVRWVGHRLV